MQYSLTLFSQATNLKGHAGSALFIGCIYTWTTCKTSFPDIFQAGNRYCCLSGLH